MSQTLFVPHQTGRHKQNAVFMQSMLDLNFDDLSPSLFVQLHSGSDHDKDTFLLQSSRVGVYCFSYFYILKKYPTYNNTIFSSEGDSALLFLG